MKKLRVVMKPNQPQKNECSENSNLFVFSEKSTGFAQFRASSAGSLDATVERLAGMLAVQCLMRGTEPGDFMILVPAEADFAKRLAFRAKELLKDGRMANYSVSLTGRQKEILNLVVRNRANKEIANELNITVRTVKFHISTLLGKFQVDNRAELARRASGMLSSPGYSEGEREDVPAAVADYRGGNLETLSLANGLRVAGKSRSIRFPASMLPA